MASPVWYPKTGEERVESAARSLSLQTRTKRKPGRPSRKDKQNMTPQTQESPKTKTTQQTVFDLDTFGSLTLYKDYTLPEKPASVESALASVGNDTNRLLDVIQFGLAEQARLQAASSQLGWSSKNDDEEFVAYTGTFADEKLGKAIDGAVLNLAKAAFGYRKELSAEAKTASKQKAMEVIKSNPSVLQSIKEQAS